MSRVSSKLEYSCVNVEKQFPKINMHSNLNYVPFSSGAISPSRCGPVGWSIVLSRKGGGVDSQAGTYLGSMSNPQSRRIQETAHRCFSLTLIFLSLPSSLSESNIKMTSGEY